MPSDAGLGAARSRQLGARDSRWSTHTASDMTIDVDAVARCAHVDVPVPPTVKPVVGANATPANVTPTVPPPLPPLAAKSLGFNTEATTYHVYDVTPVSRRNRIRYAIALPKPLTPAPVVDTEFVIKGVAFGVERCFEVRPVDQRVRRAW